MNGRELKNDKYCIFPCANRSLNCGNHSKNGNLRSLSEVTTATMIKGEIC